ncbi:metalloregulator ArsR/SmtB family transcription factor [Rhodobacteraceae bacterium 2CG4]|uniref:Metalloregulator ArsR/SmtB family transcription factor n=1 Tax=Halovulum marinum TaxID=2662447 RepID=A0A6L5YUX6_9RHOB|nr:metalloregulator ArsR/SmtB family transcription factor [Halovulum marinum]MSU88088.1 metalloregulator ArsR/SmtB family transcription factor [Halovulum marinum]
MTHDADAAFRALADPTRRAIVALLAQRDMTIGAVAENFAMTRPAVRKHIAILEEGNLIRVEPRGRERIGRLHPEGLAAVSGWLADIDAFWSVRLDRLKTEIEKGNGNA